MQKTISRQTYFQHKYNKNITSMHIKNIFKLIYIYKITVLICILIMETTTLKLKQKK